MSHVIIGSARGVAFKETIDEDGGFSIAFQAGKDKHLLAEQPAFAMPLRFRLGPDLAFSNERGQVERGVERISQARHVGFRDPANSSDCAGAVLACTVGLRAGRVGDEEGKKEEGNELRGGAARRHLLRGGAIVQRPVLVALCWLGEGRG